MKPLDPHTFFKLFEIKEPESEITGEIIETYHPYIIITAIVKGVENFYIISQIYTKKYGEQFERIEHSVKHKYYNRLFNHLEKFNERKLEHLEHALAVGKGAMAWAMTDLMDFFEEVEEYEKCARLRDIMNAFDSVNKLYV